MKKSWLFVFLGLTFSIAPLQSKLGKNFGSRTATAAPMPATAEPMPAYYKPKSAVDIAPAAKKMLLFTVGRAALRGHNSGDTPTAYQPTQDSGPMQFAPAPVGDAFSGSVTSGQQADEGKKTAFSEGYSKGFSEAQKAAASHVSQKPQTNSSKQESLKKDAQRNP